MLCTGGDSRPSVPIQMLLALIAMRNRLIDDDGDDGDDGE